MSFPFWDFAKDFMVACALEGHPDPGLTMRRRVAGLLAVPALAVGFVLGGVTGSWIVGLVTFVLIMAGLWIYAERWPVIAERVKAKSS